MGGGKDAKGGGKKGGKGGKGKGDLCKKCQKPGHEAKDCWSGKVCSGCKKSGHVWEVCFTNPASPQYKPPAAKANAGVSRPAGADAQAILDHIQTLASGKVSQGLANAAVPKASAPPPNQPEQHEQWAEFQRYLASQELVRKAYGCRADTAAISSDLVLLDTFVSYRIYLSFYR